MWFLSQKQQQVILKRVLFCNVLSLQNHFQTTYCINSNSSRYSGKKNSYDNKGEKYYFRILYKGNFQCVTSIENIIKLS